ncbi:beta-lactamase-like protein [Xylogone sp. PMI_703]|nr:beta-lactamase-like protein [Xylogone sp. PMI_703]
MSPIYPTVSPLSCGYLSPPAWKFLSDAAPDAKLTMPSLSFLIQHPTTGANVVFDLSIRKDLTKYHPGLQKHIETRHPLSSENDVKSALALGNMACGDVNYVIMSHIHWDHVGTPSDFENATFVVGAGTGRLLRNEMGEDLFNPFFEKDLLPAERTVELPQTEEVVRGKVFDPVHDWRWESVGRIPYAVDMFNDEMVYIVHSPGHVPGHLNMLVRISDQKWVYLAADACHHARILKGDAEFGSWENERGKRVTIHHDLRAAHKTLDIMRQMQKDGLNGVEVEIILAHDGEWEKKNADSFFPSHL